jgi:UDP-N-acetylmuramate dehydrogenase
MSTEWPTSWFDDPRTSRGGSRRDVPLRTLTTFQIGGPARLLLEPLDPESAVSAIRRAREAGIPLRILGNGSNLLVHDSGVDGVVLSTARMRRCVREDDRFHAWAGVGLPGLVNHAAKLGLSGVEGIIGIPAHVGGAVRMNAGGKWGEIFDVVESVTVCELATGEARRLARSECNPKYRESNLGEVLVLETTLRLRPADPKEVLETTKEHLVEKNAAQPVVEASAGCIFKNPKIPEAAGRSAAKLIDDAGLKGTRVGGVEVSRKHSNYFVNCGGGTCADALALIDLVVKRVRDSSGIRLETEVQIW